MYSCNRLKMIVPVVLAVVIVLSGILIDYNPIPNGPILQFGEKASAATADTWTQKTSCPVDTRLSTSLVISGKIYVLGKDPIYGNLDTLYEYNPNTDVWTKKATCPKIPGGSTVVINDKLYVYYGSKAITGTDPFAFENEYGIVNLLYEYNPQTDTWTQKAACPKAISNIGAVAINNKMYVCGNDPTIASSTYYLYEYNPSTNTWIQKSSLNPIYDSFRLETTNNKLYVICQLLRDPKYSSTWEYTPTSNTWAQKTFSYSLAGFSTVATNDKIYIFGGGYTNTYGTSYSRSLTEYNPTTDTSVTKANIGTTLYNTSAVTISGKIYILGQSNQTDYSNQIWEFNPSTNTWTQKATDPISLAFTKSVVVGDKIYVLGGYNTNGVYSKSLWEYSTNSTPSLALTSPSTNGSFPKSIPLKGTLNDLDKGDILTIKYKLDSGTEQIVSGTVTSNGTAQSITNKNIDISMLSEGSHTLSIWIEDNNAGKSDIRNISFIKDAISPTVSNPDIIVNSPYQITVSGSGTDINLDANPLLYNRDGVDIGTWKAGSYVDSGLTPNTKYTYKYKAKDKAGNISEYSNSFSKYTLAETPSLSLAVGSPNSIELNAIDNNSAFTKYQIMCGSKYVSQTGELTDTETWITLTDKKIRVVKLNGAPSYQFRIKARNDNNIETSFSQTYSIDIPDSFITVNNPISGQTIAKPFSINCKVDDRFGKVTRTTIKINNTTYYTNENTPANNEVSYTLSAREFAYLPNGVNTVTIIICNEFGDSFERSFKIIKNVIPEITALPAGTYINFSWTPLEYVVGYEIELDGKIIKTGLKTSYSYIGLKPSTQHTYRIRTVGIVGTGKWSPLQTISTTDGMIAEAPRNILSKATNNTITINWDAVNDAEGYDIMPILFDGTEGAAIDNGSLTTCDLRGLLPNTTYKYRIRAKNAAGEGPWSDVIEVTTYYLDTPQNITTEKSDTSIKISWDAVSGADSYEIKYYPITQTGGVTGSAIDIGALNGAGFTINATETNISLKDLTPCTEYKYSIRAISSQGDSGWREEKSIYTLPQKPGIPENVNATVSDTKITINWTGLSDISVVGYDVELDGVILENDIGTIYIHEGLDPYSIHTYRVRARNDLVEGDWSPQKSIRTLPAKPVAPKDVTVTSTQTGATISWKAEQGASGYDIYVFKLDENNKEVMIEEINNIEDCTYTHRRLTKGAEYRYRIRTRNVHGISAWSGDIINNAIKAQCKKGNTIDLGLTATDIVDFSSYEMVVTFNPGVVEVTDLSTLTGKTELTVGKIEGTDITIKEFSDGRIVFVVDKAVTPGEAWTGVINAIKFKAKQTGGTTITYTVFTKPQQ